MGLKKNHLKEHKTVKASRAIWVLYSNSSRYIMQNLYNAIYASGIKTDFAESYVKTVLYEYIHVVRLTYSAFL